MRRLAVLEGGVGVQAPGAADEVEPAVTGVDEGVGVGDVAGGERHAVVLAGAFYGGFVALGGGESCNGRELVRVFLTNIGNPD